MRKIKVISLCMAVLMVVCVFPVVSLAADHPLEDGQTLDISTVSPGDTVTVAANAKVTISGSNSGIQIICGAGATVTLSGASINNSSVSYSPIVFAGSANTLILASGTTNTLSGGGSPAVCVEAPAELTIDGTGELIANSGDNTAAIGSASANACGTIHIYNATVTATNSSGGAAIGSGPNGTGGTIEIYSGTVTATNLDGWGAAIGGGEGSDGGIINIFGGTVSATCGSFAAGIGGGNGGNGGTINISGGSVTASSVNGGAAIGGGISGSGGTINISGGTVTATIDTSGSTNYGAGIGGGRNGDGGIINISGGRVTASGETNAPDIGNGGWDGTGTEPGGGTLSLDGGVELALNARGTNANVTIGDAHITDSGDTITDGFYVNGSRFLLDAENIRDLSGMSGKLILTMSNPDYLFYGKASSDFCIEIDTTSTEELKLIFFNADFGCSSAAPLNIKSGPNVKIELCGSSKLSGSGYAGIHCPTGQTLNISSEGDTAGSITAVGGANCAGIGGNEKETSGHITIQSGAVTATGGGGAAGLGNGYNGDNGGNITISGGTVTATGGENGAGIGSGESGDNCGTITITGGTVNATGGYFGAGIGGGWFGDNGTITISGTADVTALGGESAAGIGGGCQSATGNVTIENGNVNATGGYFGAGIGGGNFSVSGAVTISGGSVKATGGGGTKDFDRGGAGIGGGTACDVVTVNISGAANVTAQGGNYSAGIGGGARMMEYGANGGTVDISGGTVYATRGANAPYDIGDGSSGSGGTLSLSNMAAVFLGTDSCISPSTATHTHLTYAQGTNESFGFAIPESWVPPFGAYLRVYTLAYDANGGSGTAPASVTQYLDTTAVVANGSTLTRTNYTFNGWNTAADGSGKSCAPGSAFTFTANTTLYAQWLAVPVVPVADVAISAASGNSSYGSVSGGGTYAAGSPVTLTAVPNAGYQFVGWYNGSTLVSTGAVYTFAASANITLTAQFDKVGIPETISATAIAYNKISVSWTAVPGARGYQIYRATSENGMYKLMKSTSATRFINTGVDTGRVYYYKVRAYIKSGKKMIYGTYYSPTVYAMASLTKVSGTKIAAVNPAAVRLSWNAVAGKTKYEVWRSLTADGPFELVKATSSRSYTNIKLASNAAYFYKIRAYRTVRGSKVYGAYSEVMSAMPVMAQTAGAKAKRINASTINVSWKAVKGKTKYEVWMSTSENGDYTLIGETASQSYNHKGAVAGTAYYYKVRAYRAVGRFKYYGAYSGIISATP